MVHIRACKTNSFGKAIFVVWGLLCLVVFSACGKVTQETSRTKALPSYDLKFLVNVVLTSDAKPLDFTIEDTPLFVQVEGGGQNTDQFVFQSWGKSLIEVVEVKKMPMGRLTTGNREPTIERKYITHVFDKRGIEVTGRSDHSWSKPVYSEAKKVWQVESRKIDRQFPFYLVKVFSGSQRYRMKFIDQDVVSKNAVVNAGEIALYDTFLSVMRIMLLEQGKDSVKNREVLTKLFDLSFFSSLVYRLPKNQTVKFDEKNPKFNLVTSFETLLFEILEIAQFDKDEAVKKVKKWEKGIITEKSFKLLIANIRKLKI
ncbi:MAG: hypothetical protein ACI9BD_000457 [Candidatus Marinamargulisbacteria bacterium]|jgi:hypothetical protein